tara:strand:- start:15691 stop:16074 length:384 start_codon:yes stop_codon:yes gene_type:complete
MGYRSEIVAGVPLKDRKKALSIINDWNSVGTGMITRFWEKNPDGSERKPEAYFYMQADWWKWYNDYPEIDKFEKFILEDTENRFLTCLGEDGHHHTNFGDSTMHDIYVMSTLAVEGNIKWRSKKEQL